MPLSLRCSSTLPLASCAKQLCKVQPYSHSFSTTRRNDVPRPTRARRAMYRWLEDQGRNFVDPLPGSTNYLSAYNAAGKLTRLEEAEEEKRKKEEEKAKSEGRKLSEIKKEADESNRSQIDVTLPPESKRDLQPYPLNPSFVSQPVLSEELREEIWKRVMKEGMSVREVSAQLQVEMSRVGAVVRLKEVEKEWERIGKPLARPYHEAVIGMLPTTPFDPNGKVVAHESINDLPVHRRTGQQIFHPTSESRHFTRADAAKVFDEKLLPADDRVPHPELAIMYKEQKEGLSHEEREARLQAREKKASKKSGPEYQRAKQEATVQRVNTARWEFRITQINVDDAGKDGRGFKGTGWRYGVPHMDRSRGQVKIPTNVE